MLRLLAILRCLVLVALGLSGCAFGDRHVVLSYPPEVAPARHAVTAARTDARTREITIVIERFGDQRTERPIGEVRNGFGMHTADVLATSDVSTWVMEAVGLELRAAGYRVRWATKDTATERVQMSGQLLTAYCRAHLSYEAEVSMMIQLNVDGKIVLNRRIGGKAGAGTNWAATESGYGDSLSLALKNAIDRLLFDVRYAIGNLPPVVPPAPPTPPVASRTGNIIDTEPP